MLRPHSDYQSLDTSEYETLEYEGADLDPDLTTVSKQRAINSRVSSVDHSHSSSQHSSARISDSSYGQERIFRTVSREDSAPLSHPVPSLRSLEGGKLANIERLEESAERLSINSDVGEGIRRLQLKQKREESLRASIKTARQFSSSSQSNSIVGLNNVARLGGFSPEGYVASPTGSNLSPWSQSVGGHNHSQKMESPKSSAPPEGRPLDFPLSEARVLTVRNSTDETRHTEDQEHDLHNEEADQGLRRHPSVDTFQQAAHEFADFDGVHIVPGRQASSEFEGPLHHDNDFVTASDGEHIIPDYLPSHIDQDYMPQTDEEHMVPYAPPDSEENMTYYPAPIPMMINLPPKLSKGPSAAEIAKRRSELLDLSSDQARQSVGNLSQLQDPGRTHSNVPPQLRASLFFDQSPGVSDLQVAGGSATETLDKILAASADAPVTAFTDHPIAGQEGAGIYATTEGAQIPGKLTKAKRASTQMSALRKTSTSFLAFGSKLRIGSKQPVPEVQEEALGDEPAEVDDKGADEEDELPLQRPSTLLAELQIRKAQQRQRNRTAATAFPNGMHSTLLQLDAVAQIQKQSRSKKHVALAWEDPEAELPDDPEDDVPLGVLFPTSKPTLIDRAGEYPEDRPLGLLAKRNIEDNEPLSRRRARLQNDPFNPKRTVTGHPSSLGLNVHSQTNDLHHADEDETLGQRRRRLRGEEPSSQARPLSSDFASEVLSQFGGFLKEERPEKLASSTTPDPEETLGQRKKRLQAEREARQASGQISDPGPAGTMPSKRRSMADLLSANPIGPRSVSQTHIPGTSLSGLIGQHPQLRTASTFDQPGPGVTARPMVPQRSWTEQQAPVQFQHDSAAINSHMYPRTGHMVHGRVGVNTSMAPNQQQYFHPAVYAPAVIPEPDMHPQQRALIDRWRQSVL